MSLESHLCNACNVLQLVSKNTEEFLCFCEPAYTSADKLSTQHSLATACAAWQGSACQSDSSMICMHDRSCHV